MHAFGLPSPFTLRRSQKRLSSAVRERFCHGSRERCLFLLIAIFVILASSPRTAYAATFSTQSQAKFAVIMHTALGRQLLRNAHTIELRSLIPLSGLPIFPAVLLWFPESNNMSDVQVVGVQTESSEPDSRSYRWLRIGMLILFAMGVLGMLFS